MINSKTFDARITVRQSLVSVPSFGNVLGEA